MTRIRPFRALRYDPARVDLARVIAPPYDVISPAERVALYDRDPHNAIRLDLTREVAEEATTDYAQIAATLAAWRRERVLVRDPEPGLYALRQRFTAPDGGSRTRESFFALLGLEDLASGVVRPHERTLSAPKQDRLRLLRATRANLSSLLLLYQDPDDKVFAALRSAFDAGAIVARDAGAEHEVARVGDPAAIEAARAYLADRPVVIADGHHRYETALLYRDECRAAGEARGAEAPFEWVLACFANADAPGTLLLPIHRVILRGRIPSDDADWRARLPGWTERSVPVSSPDDIPQVLERDLAPTRDRHVFAADDGSGRLRIFECPREGDELTIRRIHTDVVAGVFDLDEAAVRDGAVAFPKSTAAAAAAVRGGPGHVALYLNALTPDEVFRVTAAGEVLPQKSTFFLPKLPTGLLFRVLGEEA